MIINGSVTVASDIIGRLRDLKVYLQPFTSAVRAGDSKLKGIDFKCNDLGAIKRAFDNATDYAGRRAFYYSGKYSSGQIARELIRNAPSLLDMSFAASHGYGYREIRDMPLVPSLRPSLL